MNKRIPWILLAVAAPATAAEMPTVSGRAFSNVYLPTFNTTTQDIQQVDTEAWLTVTEKPNEHITAKITFVGQVEERPKDQMVSQNGQFQVREGYVRYRDEGWDFQAGKILLPWGKADVINPTDYFSAKNYQVANWDQEVQRIGPTAFILSNTPNAGASPVTMTAVLAPIFAQDKILIPPTLIPTGFTVNTPTTPRLTTGTMEAALKLAYAGSGWDFSVSGFHGWNHFQDLAPTILAGNGASTTPIFHRVSALGSDFSSTLGDFVFRVEGAYHWTQDSDGSTPWVSPPSLDLVAGVERPVGDRFRLQVQGLFRHLDHFNTLASFRLTNPIDAATVQANSLLQQYQFQNLPGATARLSYTSAESDWEAELFVLSYFPMGSTQTFSGVTAGPEYYIRPRISHDLTTGLKTTLGMDIYVGPGDRLFGASRDYSATFLEVLYVL